MERGKPAVERRTRNQGRLCSNYPLLPFQSLGVLATDGGGDVSDLVVARNCCMARTLPREAELVSE